MPTVPVYRSQVNTSKAPDTRLGLRANDDQFGAPIAESIGALGRGIASAGNSIENVQQRERQKIDQTVVLEAKNALESKVSPHLAAAKQTRGKEAIGAGGKLLPVYDQTADEIEKGLTSEDQRLAFRAYRQSRRVDIQSAMDNHAAAGASAYADAQFEANGVVYGNRIIESYQNEGQVNAAVFDRLHEIRQYAERNGLPAEWTAAKTAEAKSNATRTVITAHMDAGNDLAAKKWLDRYGDELTAEDKSYATRLVEAGASKNEGVRQGLRIYEGGKSMEDAFAEADQIENPKVRDETKRWLDEKYSLAARAKQADEDNLYEQTYNDIAKSPLGLSGIPESRWQLLRPEHRERLEAYFKVKPDGGTKLPWETSKARRYEIESALANPEKRAALVARGPGIFLGTMNEDDQNAVASLMGDLKSGKGTTAATMAGKDDMLKEAMVSLGLDPEPVRITTAGGKATVRYNERAVKFRDGVQRRLDEIAASGKPVDSEANRVAVDAERLKWAREITTPGRVYGTNKTRFADTDAATKMATRADQVPEADRAVIEAAFQRRGAKPTPADLIDAYNAKLEADARAR
jgi:hypothetical protein